MCTFPPTPRTDEHIFDEFITLEAEKLRVLEPVFFYGDVSIALLLFASYKT
jgi:hypothetical protein